MDYYNQPMVAQREMTSVPNRVVTFQVDERPTRNLKRCKASVPYMDTYKLIPVVVATAGIVLIVIGISYYIYNLVQFVSAVHSYSDRHDNEGMRSFWDFMFYMVTITLTSEIIVVILTSIFGILLYNSIFSCNKITQLSNTVQKILKSITLLLVGVVICCLQTLIGVMRFSIQIKINHWLSEVNCGCGYEE